MVVRELLATVVRAHRLNGQSLAQNDLVFKLDVFQLVPELGGVRAVTTWPAGARVSSKTKLL